MKTNRRSISEQRGFTLIELIVTFALTAIMAAMYIQIMGVSLIGNVNQINRLNNSMSLYQVMEAMIADYTNVMVTSATPLATFSSRVQSNAGNYGTYTVVTNSYVTYDASGNESAGSGTGTGPKTLRS